MLSALIWLSAIATSTTSQAAQDPFIQEVTIDAPSQKITIAKGDSPWKFDGEAVLEIWLQQAGVFVCSVGKKAINPLQQNQVFFTRDSKIKSLKRVGSFTNTADVFTLNVKLSKSDRVLVAYLRNYPKGGKKPIWNQEPIGDWMPSEIKSVRRPFLH